MSDGEVQEEPSGGSPLRWQGGEGSFDQATVEPEDGSQLGPRGTEGSRAEDADGELRADPGSGAGPDTEAGVEVSEADFLKYMREEVEPVADKLGYVVVLKAKQVPPAKADHGWPAWYYDPVTKVGQIFSGPEKVPNGWVANPHI